MTGSDSVHPIETCPWLFRNRFCQPASRCFMGHIFAPMCFYFTVFVEVLHIYKFYMRTYAYKMHIYKCTVHLIFINWLYPDQETEHGRTPEDLLVPVSSHLHCLPNITHRFCQNNLFLNFYEISSQVGISYLTESKIQRYIWSEWDDDWEHGLVLRQIWTWISALSFPGCVSLWLNLSLSFLIRKGVYSGPVWNEWNTVSKFNMMPCTELLLSRAGVGKLWFPVL